jgi:hypothetical protein
MSRQNEDVLNILTLEDRTAMLSVSSETNEPNYDAQQTRRADLMHLFT